MGRSFFAESLTENFYRWEVRGRGWQVWESPVNLEPPFVPYHIPSHNHDNSALDDGRRHTFLSSFIEKIRTGFSPQANNSLQISEQLEKPDIYPIPFPHDNEIQELQVSFPVTAEISQEYCEQFLLSLSSSSLPISFEILGTREEISLHFGCRTTDIYFLHQQIKAFFPEAIVREGEVIKEKLEEGPYSFVVDCGLNEEFMRPIKTFKHFNPDPLTTIYGALANLNDQEIGLVQILFQSTEAPWASSIIRAVRTDDGTSFFADAPEMVKLAEKKISRPLFSVVLRVIGKSPFQERAFNIVKNLYGGLSSFTDPLSNEFIPLDNDDYEDFLHFEDVIYRRTRRSGMLLNNEELLGLVHFPLPGIHISKFKRDEIKSREVPQTINGHNFIIGENIHRNISRKVSLNVEQRLRHVHIIGKSGTGKSTLLINMVKQDIETGRGVAVLDPHGDLIDRIMEFIPENRLEDVILLDPSDTEYPVGFNILEARSEMEKTVLSSDLVELFRRFSTSWGDQMTAVLANAVIAFVESGTGGTLIDLKRFLMERDFRCHILNQGVDSSVVYFWEKEFPLLKGSSQVSIITRLDAFLRSKLIRGIITKREGLNFSDIIEGKKVFLAKLSQGIIGEENAYLLGSLICSKLHQTVMGRQSLDAEKRSPFFFYVDEFQHFATPSMASMLSGSRKYAFGLTLAHQDLQQITDNALANSVITNPAVRVCFALGDNDAQKLESGFAHFDASDLMNLGTGESIVRVEKNDNDFNLKTSDFLIADPAIASARREMVIINTRKRYGQTQRPNELYLSLHAENEPVRPFEKTSLRPSSDKLELERRIQAESKRDIVESNKVSTPPVSRIAALSDDLIVRKSLSQHRYLQTLIKKMAEQHGYRSVIEKPTPAGGRVDVALEREGKKIAVEISVTTGGVQELHNVEKCLKGGYVTIIVCSPERRNLETIRRLVTEKLQQTDLDKVKFLEPEELFLFLDQQTAREISIEKRIKGYRVKVQYQVVSEAGKRQKRDTVAQVIVNAMKKMNKETR